MVTETMFTTSDVLTIVSIVGGLVGVYWLLSNKIDAIKHDTRATREWHTAPNGARDKLDELHKWHNVKDEDGVPVWYVRKSFETAMIKVAESTEKLASILESIHRDAKHNTAILESMNKDIGEILKQQRK